MNDFFEKTSASTSKATLENPDLDSLQFMTAEEKKTLLNDLFKFQTASNPGEWKPEHAQLLLKLLEDTDGDEYTPRYKKERLR